jgi:hypothetical protein
MDKHTLEPAAREFADAAAKPPFLYELGPERAPKALEDIQAATTAAIEQAVHVLRKALGRY